MARKKNLSARSVSLSSDHEFFQRSDTPREDYGECDEGQQWPVKAIVSEEIDFFRDRIFQIEWDGWQRGDGTNTTWSTNLPGANTLIRSWNSTRSRQNHAQARASPDIDLVNLASYMPHNIRTAEYAVAYSEKLQKWHVAQDDWDTERNQAQHESRRAQKRKRLILDLNRPSLDVGRNGRENTTILSHASSSSAHSNPPSKPSISHKVTPESVNRSQTSLQDKWTEMALAAGAAGIRIVNEVDDEVVPPVHANFVYLEDWCIPDIGVPKQDVGFLIGCECTDGCKNPLLCPCLMDSQCIDEDGEVTPAYSKGLFLFNNQLEVVECNKKCSCRKCSNRVAQRPRKVPLEIFKTLNNGWGVRPSEYVPKGTVLGLYTGLLMKRNDANSLLAEKRDYTFALDARDDDIDCTDKYSVCAYAAGNWTRFVNHSCGPSAKVYSVVINTAVHMNMPHVAFVASEDIPPGKEITIDYKPSAAWCNMRKKAKAKGKSNETICNCGSDLCRGFI